MIQHVDEVARVTGFSGVVRVDVGVEVVVERAYGLACRPCDTPNQPGTRFAVASATKPLTALVVVSLIADGVLSLDTTARSLLGDDLPDISADVTVEHLLAHRSGIGDHVDEDLGLPLDAHVLNLPVHRLVDTDDHLALLHGIPPKFPPGEAFSYSNAGYVLLAALAERAAGTPFADLVEQRVCCPAGMDATAFLRADALGPGTAVGYLDTDSTSMRTNALHLPVRGSGDGGIWSTAADLAALWRALLGGRVIPPPWVERVLTPSTIDALAGLAWGWGCWLRPGGVAAIEGCDAGVSCRSVHDRTTETTHTTISNTSDGAWPVTRRLDELLGLARRGA